MTTDEVPIRKNPDCPVCGGASTIDSVDEIEYDHPFAVEG